MKTKTLACLSLTAFALSAVCFAATRRDPRFADKEHLSSLQLYRMGHPSTAIKENVGRFVTLEVTITHDLTTPRVTPLAQINIPHELTIGGRPVRHPISAHLEGSNTDLKELRVSDHTTIEGIIVNEGYGAYFIYVNSVIERKRPKTSPRQ